MGYSLSEGKACEYSLRAAFVLPTAETIVLYYYMVTDMMHRVVYTPMLIASLLLNIVQL